MPNLRGLIFLSTLLLWSCAPSQSLYRSAGDSFGKAVDLGGDVINAELRDARRNARMLQISDILQGSTPENEIDEFAQFACGGTGAYSQHRGALVVLEDVSKTITVLSAPPSEDLSKLVASIEKYEGGVPPAEDPDFGAQKAQEMDCFTFVATELSIALDRQARFLPAALAAALSVFDAAQKVYETGKKLVILFKQQEDEAIRNKALRDFIVVLEEHQTMEKIFGHCAKEPQKKIIECLAADDEALFNDATLEAFLDDRRRYALLLPFYQFRALLAAPRAGAIEQAKVMEAASVVDINLARFDALWDKKPVKGLAAKTLTSYDNLRRYSRAEFTDKEQEKMALESIQTFFGFIQNLAETSEQLKKDLDGLKGTVQKLPF